MKIRDASSDQPLNLRFESSDGMRIAWGRWPQRGSLRGVVQIAHGLGEHMGRYGETIHALTSAGFIVYGNDHRGHGRTALVPEHFGNFGAGGFELLVEDMARLSRIAKAEHPDAPLFLLGHGLGSFAAQQYVIDHSREIDGLLLSGSGVLDSLARRTHWGPPSQDVLNYSFDPERTPFDWLSRDNAVVDAFMADPLCFDELKPTALASFFASAPRLADPRKLRSIRSDLPIYIISGADDPIGEQLVGVQALIERYREADVRNVAHDFYPAGRHEMLNEINRDEVRARLLTWISSVLDQQRT